MKRDEILNEAKVRVGARSKAYGEPENNFKKIADLWTAYLDVYLDEHDVALMMCLFKIARASAGFSADNYVDLCGYGACAGEVRFSGADEGEIGKHLPFAEDFDGLDTEDGETDVYDTDLTVKMDMVVNKVMELLERKRTDGKDNDQVSREH